jgi:outer membrane receptor for ferrienterochelin and colicin
LFAHSGLDLKCPKLVESAESFFTLAYSTSSIFPFLIGDQMGNQFRHCTLFCAALLASVPLSAEEANELSLSDLFNLKVDVASQTAKPLRETPGIVTVMTRQDLMSFGPVSLREVLEQVPGFSFLAGSEATVAPAIRGQMVADGKVLVLRDGNSMVESAWGTFSYDDHLDLNQVERIEIIRGPGSAMYGGEAEMAVINIISRSPSSYSGFEVNAFTRVSRYANTGNGASFGWGNVFASQEFEASLTGSWVTAQRSTQTFGSAGSMPLSMEDHYGIESGQLNLYTAWQGLELRAMMDRYRSGVAYQYPIADAATGAPAVDSLTGSAIYGDPLTGQITWDGYYANLQKKFALRNDLSLKARLRAKYQRPWAYEGDIRTSDGYQTYDVSSSRFSADFGLDWVPSETFDVVIGGEALTDRVWKNEAGQVFGNGSSEVENRNLSQFSELTVQTDYVNFISGYRFDNNERFGNSFVPRFAATKAWKTTHLKLLYSKAFKSPNVYVAESEGIKPEKTTVIEAEAGALLGDHWSVTTNVFSSEINGIIFFVPSSDPANVGNTYANLGSSKVAGAEFEVKGLYKLAQGTINYANYMNTDDAPNALVIGPHDKARLGMPQHRVNARGILHIQPWMDLSVSGNWVSSCTVVSATNSAAEPVAEEVDPMLLLNAGLSFQPPFVKQLKIELAMQNVTDVDRKLLVVDRSGSPSFPGMGREYRLAAGYKF